jgi:hypothetical protein
VARRPTVGFEAPHDDFEMPRLISCNRADVSAIDEHGNRVRSGPTHAMRARQIPRLNVVGSPRQPILHAFMIVRPVGGNEKIKNSAGFTEREPRAKLSLHSLQLWRGSSRQQRRQSV